MIKFLLTKTFGLLIGNFTPAQKAEFWNKFNMLLSEVAKSAAQGATEGMIRGANNK